MHGDYRLPALSRLGDEDQQFAFAFILGSGSLKAMAKIYGVSYPTVRNRLDELIARLKWIAAKQDKVEAAHDSRPGRANTGGDEGHASGNDE